MWIQFDLDSRLQGGIYLRGALVGGPRKGNRGLGEGNECVRLFAACWEANLRGKAMPHRRSLAVVSCDSGGARSRTGHTAWAGSGKTLRRASMEAVIPPARPIPAVLGAGNIDRIKYIKLIPSVCS